jgi:phage tail sheath protein FI
MPTYSAPGVYYERADAGAPAIAFLRTDVAGFVGIARRGPLHQPLPIQSWRQFEAHFGEFSGNAFLAYAVRAFFENGGRRCWVARVASEAAGTAAAVLKMAMPAPALPAWRVEASSAGVWGNDLTATLRETHRAQTRTRPSPGDDWSYVASVSGFARGTHVRLTQEGAPPRWKVVSDVDAQDGRLLWVHHRPEARLPWDRPLAGLDASQPILVESVEYTLILREAGALLRVYEDLSLVPEHPRYGPALLAPLIPPRPGQTQVALPLAPEPILVRELRSLAELALAPQMLSLEATADGDPDLTLDLTGGADGLAALRVEHFVGERPGPLDVDDVRRAKLLGLSVLEEVDEVSVIAVPDIHVQPVEAPPLAPPEPCVPDKCLPMPVIPAPPRPRAVGDVPPRFSEAQIFQVQSEMVAQCERRADRVALLDPTSSSAQDGRLGVAGVQAWRSRFDTKYAALYYPWLRVVDPLRAAGALTRPFPPSGHVAGQIARTDLSVGVHKAPANAPLAWAQDVTAAVDAERHGLLNDGGINLIRALPGRGLRILGARTLTSNGAMRYLNVRRLLIMIEKAVAAALQWAVFEPNDFLTRSKIGLSLTNFLATLWRGGALMGDSPEEAFFVRCDETNNPPEDRNQGRLLAEVGVAASQPFEFVVVRVGRTDNAFEITEAETLAVLGA